MNLKKTVVTLFAASAITMSMAAPVALADDTKEVNASVGENGTFSYSFDPEHNVEFTGASVDTKTGSNQVRDRGAIKFIDDYAYSNGFTLQLSVGEFSHTVNGKIYTIPNSSLAIRDANGPIYIVCSGLRNGGESTNGNAYQKVQSFDTSADGVPLSTPQNIVTVSAGRGCGESDFKVDYIFTAPAGTYTGGQGQTATYTADMTLSLVNEPAG